MNPQFLNDVPNMDKHFGIKADTFDKGSSLLALSHDLALLCRLKEQYSVRFLPTQVIRRAKCEGINPFAL